MARRRNARLRRSQQWLWLTAGAAGATIAMTAWLGAAALDVSPYGSLDENYCPDPTRISRDIVLIMDATDPWSEIRRTAVRRELESLRSALGRFDRISLYAVEPSLPLSGSTRLVVCNPGSVAQIEDESRRWWVPRWMVSNERVVQRFHDRFHEMVDSVITEIGSVPVQATSPIIETVRAAAVSTRSSAPLEIILVSDMYQNSGLFSAYRRPDWPLALADSLADVFAQGTRHLAGARITLYLLSPADVAPDVDALRRFWTRFFDAQGAVLWHIERLEA